MTEKELTEALKDLKKTVVEQGDATRGHVSGAIDSIAHNTQVTKDRVHDMVDAQKEQRGQLTAVKERVQHLIKVFDDWLHSRKPPTP